MVVVSISGGAQDIIEKMMTPSFLVKSVSRMWLRTLFRMTTCSSIVQDIFSVRIMIGDDEIDEMLHPEVFGMLMQCAQWAWTAKGRSLNFSHRHVNGPSVQPGAQPLHSQEHITINKIIHKKISPFVKVRHNICSLNNRLSKEKLGFGLGLCTNLKKSTIPIFVPKRSCICIIWLNKSNWVLCYTHDTREEKDKDSKDRSFARLQHDAIIPWAFVKTRVTAQNVHCCAPINGRFIIDFESTILRDL